VCEVKVQGKCRRGSGECMVMEREIYKNKATIQNARKRENAIKTRRSMRNELWFGKGTKRKIQQMGRL